MMLADVKTKFDFHDMLNSTILNVVEKKCCIHISGALN